MLKTTMMVLCGHKFASRLMLLKIEKCKISIMKTFLALFAFLNLKSYPFEEKKIILVPTLEDLSVFILYSN